MDTLFATAGLRGGGAGGESPGGRRFERLDSLGRHAGPARAEEEKEKERDKRGEEEKANGCEKNGEEEGGRGCGVTAESSWMPPSVTRAEIRDNGAPCSNMRNDVQYVNGGNNENDEDRDEAESSKEDKMTEYMPMLGHRPFGSPNLAGCPLPVLPYDSDSGMDNNTKGTNEEVQTDVFLRSAYTIESQENEKEEKPRRKDTEGDIFLSNSRLNSFDKPPLDDAATPLEKLLRESALTTTSPHNTSEMSEKAYDSFKSVYQPAAAKPPVRLLEAQRHQLEIERRLAQRERDKIERSLEDRHKDIRLPAGVHAPLTYEPSRDFARKREAILSAFPAAAVSPASSRLPQPSVGVSPISSRSFVQSPTAAEAPRRDWQTVFVAEAVDAKTAAGLAGVQHALELQQRFVAGMPRSRASGRGNAAPGALAADSAAETYRRRLACIRELYAPDTTARTNAVFHFRRPLATPPVGRERCEDSRDVAERPPAAEPVAQPKRRAPHRHIQTPPFPQQETENVWERSADAVAIVSKPVLGWDVGRSGNVLVSQKGTTCLADASRALKVVTEEALRTGQKVPSVTIPMFALGTIGVSTGEFIFEVRIDAHPSLTKAKTSEFAVGMATKYYHDTLMHSPAYLYRSNGTIVASAEDQVGVPYGCPYESGSHITVHLDLKQRQQSFFLNGKPLGVAFRFRVVEDPEPLFPLVLLSGEGDTASFVPPSPSYLPSHLRQPK